MRVVGIRDWRSQDSVLEKWQLTDGRRHVCIGNKNEVKSRAGDSEIGGIWRREDLGYGQKWSKRRLREFVNITNVANQSNNVNDEDEFPMT